MRIFVITAISNDMHFRGGKPIGQAPSPGVIGQHVCKTEAEVRGVLGNTYKVPSSDIDLTGELDSIPLALADENDPHGDKLVVASGWNDPNLFGHLHFQLYKL